jgi:hypothetical protein
MAVVNLLIDRWAQSGYLARTVAIAYAAPIAIWGVCTIEATLRCGLRALHTLVAFNQESRIYRWEETQTHFWTAYGTSLLTGVSILPILGTGRSFYAMIQMIRNHTINKWSLRDLQQRANCHAVDTLYQELNAWEPDLDKILSDAVEKVAPSQVEFNETADNLRASLIGNSWIFSSLFHTVNESCKALKIVAIKIKRLILAIFSGRIIRFVVRAAIVFKDAVKQQVQYTCNLIEQPRRYNVAERSLPEIHRDFLYCILEQCSDKQSDWKEETRLAFAGIGATERTSANESNYSRQFAVSNLLTHTATDGPMPEGAPEDYFHTVKMLPKACAYYSSVKKTDAEKNELLKYFQPILPFIEIFEAACTANMTGAAKQELLWSLTKLMPNLHEITLDMQDVEPRWQLLIAAQLAKFSPLLEQVTFQNADLRTMNIMRRYCTVT